MVFCPKKHAETVVNARTVLLQEYSMVCVPLPSAFFIEVVLEAPHQQHDK